MTSSRPTALVDSSVELTPGAIVINAVDRVVNDEHAKIYQVDCISKYFEAYESFGPSPEVNLIATTATLHPDPDLAGWSIQVTHGRYAASIALWNPASNDNTSDGRQTMTGPRNWDLYGHHAQDSKGAQHLNLFSDIRSVKMCGSPDPIVKVSLVEDPYGDYQGWVATGETQIIMVQHHRIFNMQFPAGYKAEVDLGRGEAVRLRVDGQQP
ncbi:MAG: hypothetical protein ACOH1Y_15825 [Propionicimonas sp.]